MDDIWPTRQTLLNPRRKNNRYQIVEENFVAEHLNYWCINSHSKHWHNMYTRHMNILGYANIVLCQKPMYSCIRFQSCRSHLYYTGFRRFCQVYHKYIWLPDRFRKSECPASRPTPSGIFSYRTDAATLSGVVGFCSWDFVMVRSITSPTPALYTTNRKSALYSPPCFSSSIPPFFRFHYL